jgi:hypothetical protein
MKRGNIAAFIGLGVLWSLTMEATAYELSHGRQVLLNRGLQVQGYVYFKPYSPFTNVEQYLSANFSTINFDGIPNAWLNAPPNNYVLDDMPPNSSWGRSYVPEVNGGRPGNEVLTTFESGYAENFVSFGYYDEVDITNSTVLADMTAKIASWNSLYPNTLTHANLQYGFTAAQLTNYIQVVRPDMLQFDYYPGYNINPVTSGSRIAWYAEMQKYRTVALAGVDGRGTKPIAYGQFLQLYRPSYTAPLPSETFVRLQQFASWAFGFSDVSAYMYNSQDIPPLCSVMFSGPGDTSPQTPLFEYVAETNRQSLNLGPALVRLVSTDVRLIRGKVNGTSTGSIGGISGWSKGAGGDRYITGITPLGKDITHPSTTNYSDTWIGYFQPLLADNATCTFADGLHFMIVNGAWGGSIPVDAAGLPDSSAMAANSADALAEWYRITFDFTGSDFNSLIRLSRDTGRVELVPLTAWDEYKYSLDLRLPGGTGDLFAFWNSNEPLPSIPEPNTAILSLSAMIGAVLFRTRLSRPSAWSARPCFPTLCNESESRLLADCRTKT